MLTRAWLCGPSPPNPRASMAVASVVDRLIDSHQQREGLAGRNALTLFSSPRPRDLRDAVRAAQSSCSTENSRMPARPPYTNRSGSLRIWLNASARSVASMPSTAMMAGMPMARLRMPVATASSADRSVMCISPPLPPGLAALLAVQQHGEGGARGADEDRPGGPDDVPGRQPDAPQDDELQHQRHRGRDPNPGSAASAARPGTRPISRYAGLRAARERRTARRLGVLDAFVDRADGGWRGDRDAAGRRPLPCPVGGGEFHPVGRRAR